MKLSRLARIAWSRKLLVMTPVACSLLGGIFVIVTFPPRYEATSRVMLDIIKPDPITGFSVSSKNYDAYVNTQARIIRDEQVGGRVVEEMGWLENPDMLAAWQAAPDKGDDFRRWAARRITFGTGVQMVEDTNILAIKYQSTAPDLARVVADNIRTAYLEETVGQQRASARAGSIQYGAQADRERDRLLELQVLKSNLERATGLVSSDGAPDTDSRHLRGLLHTVPTGKGQVAGRDGNKALRLQLQQMNMTLETTSQALGPNNPQLVQLRSQRDLLANQLALAEPHQASPGENVINRAQLTATLIGRQVEKILDQGDKALALKLVQDEIDRRRRLYLGVTQRAGELGELAEVADANLTAIGATTVNPVPKFPNIPLILGGSGGLGLFVGLLLAFLTEALGRRVRTVEDLRSAIPVGNLGALPRIALAHNPQVRVKVARRPKPPKPPKAAKAQEPNAKEAKRKWKLARA